MKQCFFCLLIAVGIFVFGCIMSFMNDASTPVARISYRDYLRAMKEGAGNLENRALLLSQVESVTADELYHHVRIVCLVLTMPSSHKTKAKAVKETWGRRCQKLIFISTEEDESIGAVAVNVTEDRSHLWEKTKTAYNYTWTHFHNETDWFLKADDDTYIIMENLRYMLSPHNPNDPLWFGHRFKKFTKQGYMSGGAGYVLSKEAVRRFLFQAVPNPKICRTDAGGAEDAEMGKCLDKVGVVAVDSRDDQGRERFHPFEPTNHLVPGSLGKLTWYWDYAYYLPKMGLGCCSRTAISFHYIYPDKMYELEYFIYKLRPFGIPPYSPPFPPPPGPVTNSNVLPVLIPEDILAKMKKEDKSRVVNITLAKV